VNLEVERAGAIRHQQCWFTLTGRLHEIAGPGKKIDGRRRVEKNSSGLENAFERRVVLSEWNDDVESIARALRRSFREATKLDKVKSRWHRQILLNESEALQRSRAAWQERVVIVEADRPYRAGRVRADSSRLILVGPTHNKRGSVSNQSFIQALALVVSAVQVDRQRTKVEL
jgi:hypothetical protein